MSGHREIIAGLRSIGWVDTDDATTALGIKRGGNNVQYLTAKGIKRLAIPLNGDTERSTWLWWREDLETELGTRKAERLPVVAPPPSPKEARPEGPAPVGGERNGGKLLTSIRELTRRIEELEAFRRDLEG